MLPFSFTNRNIFNKPFSFLKCFQQLNPLTSYLPFEALPTHGEVILYPSKAQSKPSESILVREKDGWTMDIVKDFNKFTFKL